MDTIWAIRMISLATGGWMWLGFVDSYEEAFDICFKNNVLVDRRFTFEYEGIGRLTKEKVKYWAG
jgi:hypothetical protein